MHPVGNIFFILYTVITTTIITKVSVIIVLFRKNLIIKKIREPFGAPLRTHICEQLVQSNPF